MRKAVVILLAVAIPVLAGCVTGMKGSARRQCYDAGFLPKTQEFTNCWKAIARRDNAEVGSFLVGVAAGVAVAEATKPRPPLQRSQSAFQDPPPRQCIYWTPQGKRVLQAVNGVCPMRYGE